MFLILEKYLIESNDHSNWAQTELASKDGLESQGQTSEESKFAAW
jgi:hypothetical protein